MDKGKFYILGKQITVVEKLVKTKLLYVLLLQDKAQATQQYLSFIVIFIVCL